MSKIRSVKAVLFDFDGTLTLPGLLDFDSIKKRIECPENKTILEYIETLPPGEPRKRCMDILEWFEMQAAENAKPNIDAEELLDFLRARRIAFGILTRNRRCSVITALKKFSRISESGFRTIVTREDTAMPKPHPEGVLLAAERMDTTVENMLVVGDYVYDIEAGRRAGALTVFLDNGAESRYDVNPHFTVSRLNELMSMFANGDEDG